MGELLPHLRTKGPVSTPAQRLIELQRELLRISGQLQEANQREDKLRSQLDRYHRLTDTSFGGVAMAQQWSDLWLWEAILNENPRLKAIIELGTWKGGFAWWLWAQAQARKMAFHTFDSVVPEHLIPNFSKRDVFAEADALGDWFRALEPLILLCDNGNKPRELRTYAHHLQHPDTLIVVHDWGTEILPEDVPDTVKMVYGDFCDELGSISRVFKLKEK